MDKIFSAVEAAMWMCRAVSSDGVVSESEVRVLAGFCRMYGLDAAEMLERARTYCELEDPEVVELGKGHLKGYGFERFVVRSLCGGKDYRLLTWRGDKRVDGIVAEDDRLPDLRLVCSRFMPEREFYIECKYRKIHTGWKRFKRSQLDRYALFSRMQRRKVLFIYGCGGNPEDPDRLFVMPVWELIKRDGNPEGFELRKDDSFRDVVYGLISEKTS